MPIRVVLPGSRSPHGAMSISVHERHAGTSEEKSVTRLFSTLLSSSCMRHMHYDWNVARLRISDDDGLSDFLLFMRSP